MALTHAPGSTRRPRRWQATMPRTLAGSPVSQATGPEELNFIPCHEEVKSPRGLSFYYLSSGSLTFHALSHMRYIRNHSSRTQGTPGACSPNSHELHPPTKASSLLSPEAKQSPDRPSRGGDTHAGLGAFLRADWALTMCN